MPGNDLVAVVELAFGTRVRRAVRSRQNWLQLVRFGTVGACGYAINLATFAVCLHLLALDYRISAAIAFVVSVLNNFWLNRHWTFGAGNDHPAPQALRFITVYLVTFGFTYMVLIALVDGAGTSKILAQAIANACAAPLSFVGQKLWSFRA
jgi:putative flippase GtrA